MKCLVVIPARGGSKGIPRKNIKELNGKPLIDYSIDVARSLFNDNDICVSTDDDEIIDYVECNGLKVPFKRPDDLSSDKAGSYEVLLHAIQYYENRGFFYDTLILLQPTSPFRTVNNLVEAIQLYDDSLDMVVSVKEATANPYYNCFEENNEGYLLLSKGEGKIKRRQECPKVWEYNGAIYVINIKALKSSPISEFTYVKKYPMDEFQSIDLDTQLDWEFAEFLMMKEK